MVSAQMDHVLNKLVNRIRAQPKLHAIIVKFIIILSMDPVIVEQVGNKVGVL